MKVLEVTIESAEFSEPHSYQISYQGKVETDVAAFSTQPEFKHRALYVPFAIVKNGSEYLSATVTICDDENNPKVISKDSLIIHPGKDKKELTMSVPALEESNKEGVVETDITGTVHFSYRIVTLSVVDSLKGPNGACGIAMNCHYVNTPPHDISVRVKDMSSGAGSTVGTGKLTAMAPYAYVDIKPAVIRKCYDADHCFVMTVAVSSGASAMEFNLRLNKPNAVVVKLGPEDDAFAVVTVLLSNGFAPVSALVHDCSASVPVAPKCEAVLHCELLPNAADASAPDSPESSLVEGGVAMVNPPHTEGVPPTTGPGGGLYLLTKGVEGGEGSSSTATGELAAQKHRKSLLQPSGKGIPHVGLICLPDGVDYEQPLKLRASALVIAPKAEENNNYEGCVVGNGQMEETSREFKDNIITVALSGEVVLKEAPREGLLGEKATVGDSVPIATTVSIIPKGNATFFGPHSIANTVLPPKVDTPKTPTPQPGSKSETPKREVTPPAVAREDSQPALPPVELPDAATVPKVLPDEASNDVTVTNQPGAGVEEDPESRILPVNYRPNNYGIPRCDFGHPLVRMTGDDLARQGDSGSGGARAGSTVVCDVCGKKHLETHVCYHHCAKCQFDLCNKCLPDRCVTNMCGDAVEIVTTTLVDEMLDDALVIVEDFERSNQFAMLEDAVLITEKNLVNYMVDTMLNQSIHRHIRFITAVDKENAELASELAMEKILEELVTEVMFGSEDVAKWMERFAPPVVEDEMDAQSKRLEVLNENYAPRLKDYEKAREFEEPVDVDQENNVVRAGKKTSQTAASGASTPMPDGTTSGVGTPGPATLQRRGSVLPYGNQAEVVEIVKRELKDKQSIIEKLIGDVNRRDESIVKCGLDIRRLREENLLLRKQLEASEEKVKKLAEEAKDSEQFVADLLNPDRKPPPDGKTREECSGLHLFSRPQLVKVASALSRKIQAIDREKSNVEQYISESQAIRVQCTAQAEKLKEVEEAHLQQGKVLLKYQKELRKLDKYKNTITIQEGVINKMQSIIEEKLSEDPLPYQPPAANALPVISEQEGFVSPSTSKMITPKASTGKLSRLPTAPSVKSLKSQSSAQSVLSPALMSPSASSKELRGMVDSLQEQIQSLAEENAGLRDYVQELEERPVGALRAEGEGDADPMEVETLRAEIAVKDIRIEALEDRLQKATQEYAKEVSKLRVLLFEFEMNASLEENDGELGDDDGVKRRALLEELDPYRRRDDGVPALSLPAGEKTPQSSVSRSASGRKLTDRRIESILAPPSPTTGTPVSVVRSRGGSGSSNTRNSGSVGVGSREKQRGESTGSIPRQPSASQMLMDPVSSVVSEKPSSRAGSASQSNSQPSKPLSRPSSRTNMNPASRRNSGVPLGDTAATGERATSAPRVGPEGDILDSLMSTDGVGGDGAAAVGGAGRNSTAPRAGPEGDVLDSLLAGVEDITAGAAGPELGMGEAEVGVPGMREMEGKLGLKQVGNIVAGMAAASEDDSVGFKASKVAESFKENDPAEVVPPDLDPPRAPADRQAALKNSPR